MPSKWARVGGEKQGKGPCMRGPAGRHPAGAQHNPMQSSNDQSSNGSILQMHCLKSSQVHSEGTNDVSLLIRQLHWAVAVGRSGRSGRTGLRQVL